MCVLFKPTGTGAGGGQKTGDFLSRPFKNYYHLLGDKTKGYDYHKNHQYHKEAVSASAIFKLKIANPETDVQSLMAT